MFPLSHGYRGSYYYHRTGGCSKAKLPLLLVAFISHAAYLLKEVVGVGANHTVGDRVCEESPVSLEGSCEDKQ